MITNWDPSGFKASLRAKLIRQMGKVATLVENRAKELVPVDTGHLKSTIGAKVEVQGDDVVCNLEATADYALPVELGTSRMAAHPYLRPAIFGQSAEIVKIIGEG